MDPMFFINQVFQLAALNNFALMLDDDGEVPDGEALAGWPDEALAAYKRALEAGEHPIGVVHPEHGRFVLHWFDPNDDNMRMVCWAEMGGAPFNKTACDWWKAQGANPDGLVPGVTTLHEPKPEPTEPEPPKPDPPSREAAIDMIKGMGALNPTGDRHGSIDPQFTKACREFDPDYKTDTPLTLDEWKGLTRGEDSNFNDPFARDIKDATDPFVFLVVLRDRMVFASGCTDSMIRIIGIFVDERIDPRAMTWR